MKLNQKDIYKLRIQHGFSSRKFAAIIGIEESLLNKIEDGTVKIDASILAMIQKSLDKIQKLANLEGYGKE